MHPWKLWEAAASKHWPCSGHFLTFSLSWRHLCVLSHGKLNKPSAPHGMELLPRRGLHHLERHSRFEPGYPRLPGEEEVASVPTFRNL